MKRKTLGQHFLTSQNVAKSIVDATNLTKYDTVLEIGTGRGILTKLLCVKAKSVISIEADRSLTPNIKMDNLQLKFGDGFKTEDKFNVFVSNLPYSKSRKAIEWLAQKNFDRAIIMVQKEFAEKLEQKKAISVIANHSFDIQKIINVNKNNFDPAPKVDSVVIRLIKKRTIPYSMIKTVNKIFSYRRKTIQNILAQFGVRSNVQKRLDDLTVQEIMKIAESI